MTPASAFAQAPDSAQSLQAEIDQLRKDFDAVKQQYGDRLTALEAKLAAAQPTAPAGNADSASANLGHCGTAGGLARGCYARHDSPGSRCGGR